MLCRSGKICCMHVCLHFMLQVMDAGKDNQVCVCACMRACVCVCVRACVCACVRALFLPSLHSLLEERVHSSLADDEVCPLHYHNACKEPSVTGVFQPLALIVALQITFKYMHK